VFQANSIRLPKVAQNQSERLSHLEAQFHAQRQTAFSICLFQFEKTRNILAVPFFEMTR
jgi:hypothetical protein